MTEMKVNLSSDLISRKWLLLVLLCMVPPFLLFAVGGDPGRGRAAAIALAVILVVTRVHWDLRKYAWFWVTVVVLVILHALLILLVPWTDKSYSGITLLPIAVVDYLIVDGFVKLVKKEMRPKL